jgi:hypothetical protein
MLKKMIRSIVRQVQNPEQKEIDALGQRVQVLETRLLSRSWMTYLAIDELADYLVGAQIDGVYAEFGLYQGKTFSYASKVLGAVLRELFSFGWNGQAFTIVRVEKIVPSGD